MTSEVNIEAAEVPILAKIEKSAHFVLLRVLKNTGYNLRQRNEKRSIRQRLNQQYNVNRGVESRPLVRPQWIQAGTNTHCQNR